MTWAVSWPICIVLEVPEARERVRVNTSSPSVTPSSIISSGTGRVLSDGVNVIDMGTVPIEKSTTVWSEIYSMSNKS